MNCLWCQPPDQGTTSKISPEGGTGSCIALLAEALLSVQPYGDLKPFAGDWGKRAVGA